MSGFMSSTIDWDTYTFKPVEVVIFLTHYYILIIAKMAIATRIIIITENSATNTFIIVKTMDLFDNSVIIC